MLALVVQACHHDEPQPEPQMAEVRHVVVVYGVNDNNLYSAMNDNESQMIRALQKAPAGEYAVVLYRTYRDLSTGRKKIGLFTAVSGENTSKFDLVRNYDDSRFSTDPVRMHEVLETALSIYDAPRNSLFLWGHGMAWTPFFSSHIPKLSSEAPEIHAFGGDNNSTDWMDIDELAWAIPDNVFDMIWFDACYMSNIETLYQLRHEAPIIVAYPTEIAADGLPYDLALPSIMQPEPDVITAAKALYNYYDEQSTTVTVSVMDMSRIENVARAAKAIYMLGEARPDASSLMNYSRTTKCPYYDFIQFAEGCAEANGAPELAQNLRTVLSEMIIYTKASAYDFNRRPIDPAKYSGISTHYFTDKGNAEDDFYVGLDWYKAVY